MTGNSVNPHEYTRFTDACLTGWRRVLVDESNSYIWSWSCQEVLAYRWNPSLKSLRGLCGEFDGHPITSPGLQAAVREDAQLTEFSKSLCPILFVAAFFDQPRLSCLLLSSWAKWVFFFSRWTSGTYFLTSTKLDAVVPSDVFLLFFLLCFAGFFLFERFEEYTTKLQ